jgi:hypothetical protein
MADQESTMSPHDQKRREMLRQWITEDTYELDGALRWKSNDHVVPPSTFEDAGLEVPADQRDARDRDAEESIERYRANQPAEPSDEERAEARAAHGPGVELVDAITGRRYTT